VPLSTVVAEKEGFCFAFKVEDCTNYLDRNHPSYDAMAKLAIDVEPCSSLKPLGEY
jgi:hypothetical protein